MSFAGRHIALYPRTRGDDRAATHGDPTQHGRTSPHPGPIFDHDGPVVVLERRRAAVVTTRAEKCFLRDAHVATDAYWLEVEQPRAFADPHVIRDIELPRPQDTDVVPDQHRGSDARTKCTKERDPPSGWAPPLDEHEVHASEPRRLNRPWPALVVAGACECRELTRHRLIGQVGLLCSRARRWDHRAGTILKWRIGKGPALITSTPGQDSLHQAELLLSNVCGVHGARSEQQPPIGGQPARRHIEDGGNMLRGRRQMLRPQLAHIEMHAYGGSLQGKLASNCLRIDRLGPVAPTAQGA